MNAEVDMKVRLARLEFQDALAAAATLTGGRTTKPIYSSVRIAVSKDQVRLSSTDGEAALALSVAPLVVDAPGHVVVSAERLLGIIRELNDAEILLKSDEQSCQIQGSGSQFKIYTQRVEDFPAIAEFGDEPDLSIDGHQLKRMISMVIYAAARETSRFAINGVLWDKVGKRLYMVATDGRRLARSGGPVRDSQSADFRVIVPAKALSVFDRVFQPPRDTSEWVVSVKILPNQIMLRTGDRSLSASLVEGHFPDYDTVIPKECTRIARIERQELYGAVRRAALLTTEESRAVRLSFDADRLEVSANSPEQGEARVEIPISFEGGAVAIGFNPNFLGDALKTIPYENVRLEMQENYQPGILCGEDKDEFLYVVMPVALS
jgi:DNA polymerase-3 subunit beta